MPEFLSGLQKIEWRQAHWLGAFAFGLVLFAFDALETILYDHARAPNVGLALQLFMLLVFYALWAPVVRIIWYTIKGTAFSGAGGGRLKLMVIKLSVRALILSVLHMAVLALALRIMYSPPGWGVYDFSVSVTELWIRYAGLWGAFYAAFCGAVFVYFHKQLAPAATPKALTYEVRQGNKIITLDVADIFWADAADNYVQLHTKDGCFLSRRTLSSIEEEAKAFGIIRTHRRALVNKNFVSAVVREPDSGAYHVELTTGARVPLSRRQLAAFRSASA